MIDVMLTMMTMVMMMVTMEREMTMMMMMTMGISDLPQRLTSLLLSFGSNHLNLPWS